jgi:hypothetical protein
LLETRGKAGNQRQSWKLIITLNTPFLLGEGNHKKGCGDEILHDVEGEIGNIAESVNSVEETLFDHDIDHPWS